MFHLTTVEPATYQLLGKLFTYPFIRNDFALAGGTALSLQIGHRKSIDLDIFSPTAFDTANLEKELTVAEGSAVAITGRNNHMLFTRINGIKCDFIHEPAPVLMPFVPLENARLYHAEDVAAMKLHTICGRGKRKDFFDVYALLQQYTWEELLTFFEKKYSASQLYFLWRSIIYFDDAEDDFEIEGFGKYNLNWEEIKEFIRTVCVQGNS